MDEVGYPMPLSAAPVRASQNRYPYCILWSPLPPITWFLPMIGHTGVADSTGMTWDFAGPYYINKEHMIFGRPTRYIQLDPGKCKGRSWDDAVRAGNIIFGGGELDGCRHKGKMHNLCFQNCHSHVAQVLNECEYMGFRRWNMVIVAFWFFFLGRHTDFVGFVKTWLPFALVVLVVYLFSLA